MKTEAKVEEHPILFSGPMVRAILSGEKTQTRRVCKPLTFGWPQYEAVDGQMWYDDGIWFKRDSPYGRPGDRLWVRETCVIREGSYMQRKTLDELLIKGPPPSSVYYVATERIYEGEKKTPSIHMPRWASRITLEVVGVRVERLQRITIDDVRAEGVPDTWGECDDNFQRESKLQPHEWDNKTWREQWQFRWDRIYAKRGFGWDAKPWVWVVEFRKCEPAM
ncbi:MAG: hypothetical protein V3W37_02395 [Candidatus Binatia bacterium]